MPRDMFGDVVNPSVRVGTKQWYTVPLSILTHTLGLGALIVIPLLATNALPTPQSVMAFAAVPPPPPPPPPVEVAVNPAAAPIEAPKEIKPEPPPRMTSVVRGIPAGLPAANTTVMAPPPPAAPVRVGGDIKAPTKIKNANPVYPAIARAARMSGMVILEAVIDKEGNVKDLKVVRSAGVLDQAAMDAVSQWKYTPTTLNGQPVEVIMSVTVNFTLN